MRVAIFGESYLPHLSGVTVSTETLARGLGAMGHQVLLVAHVRDRQRRPHRPRARHRPTRHRWRERRDRGAARMSEHTAENDAPEITEDRRELWRLENFLAVSGTTETHRERHLRLYRYLCDTCEHEWSDVGGWGGSAKGTRQCSWCNVVLAPGERLAPASTEPLPTENTHRVWQERFPARVIPPAEPEETR